MSNSRNERLRNLFLVARELPACEREGYLHLHCQDMSLFAEVADLLRHDADDDFLSRPVLVAQVARIDATTDYTLADSGSCPRIGRYKLLQAIGEGGFGTVFMAEQEEPIRRRVALKVIKPGMDSRRVVARFEAERQALALMDHSNIATVFDGGTTPDGRPYFVMELVKGTPLTDFCDANRLPARDRLELLAKVCDAVQHAHHKGVIHRDLKPSNVLVSLRDGVPVPKVIDFGIAKALHGPLTDKTLFTDFRQMIGTPEYMSPEQAETSEWDADTRSDVYSLGVLLYELLTGTTPFDGRELRKKGLGEMQRTIREVEPPRPSVRLSTLGGDLTAVAEHRQIDPRLLCQTVAGDLDRVVMKAMEKDRTRRYDSPRALADDLRRFLADRPVEARSPTTIYVIRKWIRRNPTAAAMAVLGCLALFGLTGTIIGIATTRQSSARADEAALRADRLTYGNLLIAAEEAIQTGRRNNAVDLLNRCPEKVRGPEWHWISNRVQDRSTILRGHVGAVRAVAYFADGQLVSAGTDGTLRLWHASGKLLRRIDVSSQSVTALAVHDATGRIACGTRSGLVSVWGADGLKQSQMEGASPIDAVCFSSDGTALLTGTADGVVTLRKADTLAVSHIFKGLTGAIQSLQFTPDDQRILASGRGGVFLWDRTTGNKIEQRGDYWQRYRAVIRPGRDEVIALHGSIEVWSLRRPRPLRHFPAPATNITSIAFEGRGRGLLMATEEGAVRLLDLETGEQTTVALGDQGVIGAIAISPAGTEFALAGEDGTVRLWQRGDTPAPLVLTADSTVNEAIALPEGRIAGISQNGKLTVWDGATGATLSTTIAHQGEGFSLDATADGTRIVTYGIDRTLRVWNAATLTPITTLATDWGARGIQLTRDGRSVLAPPPRAANRGEASLCLWNLSDGSTSTRFDGLTNWAIRSEFSRDGRWLAAAAQQLLCIWDAQSGELIQSVRSEKANPCRCVTFTPDGKSLVAGYDDGRVCIRSVVTGQLVSTIYAHGDTISAVRTTADGRRLLTASRSDGCVRVWDRVTGDRVWELRSGVPAVTDLNFDAGETRLLIAGPGGVRVWPLATRK